MIGLVFAVASSLAYGCSDFMGGLAARRAHVLKVVSVAAPASLLVEVGMWPVLGASWQGSTVGWGAASGVGSAAAFALLYQCLATGPMSILSPITAVISALIPVAVGLAIGDRIPLTADIGILLALSAVVLVSVSPGAAQARAAARAVLVAIGAGGAVAAQLVCLNQAPHHGGVAPLIVGRTVSSILVLTAASVLRARLGPARPQTLLAAGGGMLDSLANLSFLLAVRHGQLATTAVITALYPASTLLLARIVLKERLQPVQLLGVAVAVVAVTLLTVR